MKVCVIGAGPSGLTTIKQLNDEGHSVICFEKQDDIAGIWNRKANPAEDAKEMKVFDCLRLTISMKMMGYSDFMVPGERAFYSHTQYRDYLHAYADTFGLRKNITLNSEVIEVKKQPDETWKVTVLTNGKKEEHSFDALAICAGPFNAPEFNTVPDLDKFSGQVIHSSTYRNNKQFQNKRVLIVGLAESGADIAREISDVASESTLSITSYSYLLPRIVGGKVATDTFTTRFHQYESYVRAMKMPYPMKSIFGDNISRVIFLIFTWFYGLIELLANMFSKKQEIIEKRETNILGEPQNPIKIDIACELNRENIEAIIEWNKRSHNGNSTWSPQKIFSKNVSFIPNIVKGKLILNDSGISQIKGNRVYFSNNESKEFDYIVLCTGFKQNFSKLGTDLAVKDDNVRYLYKHAFHPAHKGRVAFIGYARPATGGIPIISEMQSRYFAQLCSNKLTLPDNLNDLIKKDKIWEDIQGAYSPKHPDFIVSQTFLIDSMAKEIGCLMSLPQLIFKPKLLVRHWFHPFNQACYRLTGPHSDYDNALNEMMSDKDAPGLTTLKLKLFALLFLPYFIHPKWPGQNSSVLKSLKGKPLPEGHFLSPRKR